MKRSNSMLFAAAFGAAALIANQVAGKATRDALFLSHFPVSALPMMVIMASLLSIAAGLLTARLMSAAAPSVVVPRLYVLSAVLYFIEWSIADWSPAAAAILLYLQIAILGSAVISGFWSMLEDRFDARTAKKYFGRIVAASTLGGLAGGVLAERVGAVTGVANMLPVLAVLQLVSAFVMTAMAPGCKSCKKPAAIAQKRQSGLAVLRTAPYVRNLAILILLSTVGAGLLDYIFKVKVAAAYTDGDAMVRFFAVFYTATGLATFLVQSILSRIAVGRLGISGTVGSLPLMLAFGSVAGLIFPGVSVAFAARGGEFIFRNSLFKSGYEMLYAAVPRRERRATKAILDVGVERVADLLSASVLAVTLAVVAGHSTVVILTMSAILGAVGFWISGRLRHGYIEALEKSLLSQTAAKHIPSPMMAGSGVFQLRTLVDSRRAGAIQTKAVRDPEAERILRHLGELQSADLTVVRQRLQRPLQAAVVPQVIELLASDMASPYAVEALRKVGPKITGQLVDALLDSSREFSVRRRIPRILVEFETQRSVDGLTEALFDERFEVRFHAAAALAQIHHRDIQLEMHSEKIIAAVERELDAGAKPLQANPNGPTAVEHIFRMLELVLPREPLEIALRALRSGSDHLKGTSLEYLEQVLPERVSKRIMSLLEEKMDQKTPAAAPVTVPALAAAAAVRPFTRGSVAVLLAGVLLSGGCVAPRYVRSLRPADAVVANSTAGPTGHVIVVSVDGLRPDAITAFGAPTLQRLVREGSYTLSAKTILPSKTLPSHTSMLTGQPPAVHGVSWNKVFSLNKKSVETPTVFGMLRSKGLVTAAFFSKAKFTSLQQAGTLDFSQAPGWLLPWSAQRTIGDVGRYLQNQRPNFLFVHLGDADHAGHRSGWMSKQYGAAVERVDSAIATLMNDAERSFGADNFTLIVTSDHGGHDRDHGSADPRDMTIPWIAWGRGVTPGVLDQSVTTMDTASTVLWLFDAFNGAHQAGSPVSEAFQ